jgi:tRNA(fMet)-specific endonuclease VapC
MTAAKYVLDTNVVSALMKGDPRVLSRLAEVGPAAVLIPQPVLSEIAYGIARLPKSRRKRELSTLYARILEEFGRATWTDEVSAHFGEQKAWTEKRGERLEDFDLAIAAHALAEKRVLVTADNKHMLRLPDLETEDWVAEPA